MAHTSAAIRLVSGGDVVFTERPRAGSSPCSVRVRAAFAYLKQADLCLMNGEMPLTRRGRRIEKTKSPQP